MADGRLLRTHGLNLYHLQYERLGLPSIWCNATFIIGHIAVLVRV